MNIALINHPEVKTTILLGGAHGWCPHEVVQQKYLDLGILLAEGYGMSETVATVCQTIPRWIKPGSIGFPFSGVDIRIVDPTDDTRDLPIGEEGELWIRDNSVAVGYWNNPEATAEAFPGDGWIKTRYCQIRCLSYINNHHLHFHVVLPPS